MKQKHLHTLFVVLASGISAVASSFAVYATSREFLVSSFNLIVLDYLPPWLVSGMIQRFESNALWMSMVVAGGLLSVVLGIVAVGGYRLGSGAAPRHESVAGFALATLLVFTGGFIVIREPFAAVLPALVAGGFVTALESDLPERANIDPERRTALSTLGAVIGFNVIAHALGLVRRRQTQQTEQELQDRAARLEARNMVAKASNQELDGDGIQSLVSEIGEFYVVDINPQPPSLNADNWSLSVTGLVEDEREVDYSGLREFDTSHRYKAVRCLSDDLGDDKLDTAVWTGVQVGDILDEVDINGSHAMLYGADDYYYSMPISLLRECLLAYGMNGFELPKKHGFPARLLVPNHWGKLHVKWITEIEVIDSEQGGFWQDQGWHGMGKVNAVTKLDRINRLDDRIQLVGHAYAGARGVGAVEVSIDGGENWAEATLSDALPNPDTIRQWRYEIGSDTEPEGENYEVSARLVDAEGEIQPEERTEPFPDGATGWIHRSLRP